LELTIFTIGLWLYPYSMPEQYTYRPVLGLNYGNNEGGWQIKLAYNEALAFGIATTSGLVGFVHAYGCTINTWHCCLFWHDPVANTVNGSRNNLTPETLAWSAGMTLSGQVLTVGAHAGAGANTDYRLGPVCRVAAAADDGEIGGWLKFGARARRMRRLRLTLSVCCTTNRLGRECDRAAFRSFVEAGMLRGEGDFDGPLAWTACTHDSTARRRMRMRLRRG
jgi:hypothetical protein